VTVKNAALSVLAGILAAPVFGQIIATVGSSGQPGAGDTTTPAAPSTWTEFFQGDAAGNVVENGATSLTIIANSSNDLNNRTLACQNVATSQDFQIKATISNQGSWTGYIEDFTGYGLVILEDVTTTSSYYLQVWSPWIGNPTARVKYDDSPPASPWTEVTGLPGEDLPQYLVLSYDASLTEIRAGESDDGTNWTEIAEVSKSLTFGANFNICVWGTSHQSGAETTATITNAVAATGVSAIDWYTPAADTGPSMSQIANQAWEQGTAVSLDVSGNCTGGTSPYTFSQTGLPGGTGISFSSGGAFSGTPNATDASSSPFGITVTCTDNDTNTAQDTFEVIVSPSPGSDFLIATSTSSFDCNDTNDDGNTTTNDIVAPGDTITLDGTSRGPLTLRNCEGTQVAPIVVRNDATESGRLAITKSDSSAGGYVFRVFSSKWLTIDGVAWSGAPAGGCGINQSTLAEETNVCGIVISQSAGVAPSSYLKFDGEFSDIVISDIEIDGNNPTSGDASIGIALNDSNIASGGTACPLYWDNLTVQNNYIHDLDQAGEGIYVGLNWSTIDSVNGWCTSNVDVSYNLIQDVGRDCTEIKSVVNSDSSFHHNHCYRSGNQGVSGQARGFTMFEGGGSIYNNYFEDTGFTAIGCATLNVPAASWGPFDCFIYNNIINDTGITLNNADGITATRQSTTDSDWTVQIYNNTIVNPDRHGIVVGRRINAAGYVRDNVIAGVSGSYVIDRSDNTTVSSNQEDTVANQNFNATTDSPSSFHLTGSSPALSNASSCNSLTEDFDDDARSDPCSQGADEG
jgi:hypothetical protein